MHYLADTFRNSNHAHRVYLSVLCGSQNEEQLYLFTAINDRFLGVFVKSRKATISFVVSVYLSIWKNSVPIGFIFTKFDN